MTRTVLLMTLSALVLTNCARQPHPRLDSLTPVCTALIGPIKYNSTNPKSARHAGPALAPDLKQRNQVGRSLGCAAYKVLP